ncbi:MAG: lytic murein transglycosylase [bacterium]|nr:lytic murein transglycosylase [bacterium]
MKASALLFCVGILGIAVVVFVVPHLARAQSEGAVAKRQAELQAELEATQKDIAYWATILASKEKETVSISRDIAILNAKIAEAKATIKAKNIIIQQLGKDIGEKTAVITSLNQKLEKQKDSLSGLIRKANTIEAYSVAEFALSGQNLSGFLGDLDAIRAVEGALKTSFEDIRATRTETETVKEALNKRQSAETDARKAIEAEQRQIQKSEAKKKELLAISKTEEKTYKGILSEREKRAAQIRSALFALRDSAAIPFGTAYGYALEVQKKTGVRPAFLLAILTQETNLGENVGQCLVTNFTTGGGVGKNTGTAFTTIMKPGRDLAPFLRLAERLGFDPKQKPVSCPQKGGYGGAMGPSQFIPSTWVSFEKRIASASGVSTPDPWIPRDAFFASGIYLSDLGADAGGYSAESTAAAKYYAGSAWKTKGKTYAGNVMSHATNIQENMIDPLQNL